MDADEFLAHYGKKGMKWGSRKTNVKRDIRGSGKKPAKPKAKELSDDDLRKAVNRMQMEKQYNSLVGNTSKKEAGAKFIKGIATTAVKTTLTAVATQQVASALKKTKLAK